jgi:UDP-N-acetylmuramyl pentapeptide synthase
MEELFQLFYNTSGVFIDTRNVKIDGLFVALKGSNFNGNTFATQETVPSACGVANTVGGFDREIVGRGKTKSWKTNS